MKYEVIISVPLVDLLYIRKKIMRVRYSATFILKVFLIF